MVVPSKTKIVCHFSTLVLTCGQPHTLQIVPRDEYDNPTNNSMSLRDEHNYTLSIHEVSAFSFPSARKLGSLLGTSLPALVFPLTLEPSRLYFIVHVCLGSVRHRLKEPGQALMKHMESHFASCSSVLKKTRTMKSHLRSRWHPTSRRARCSCDSPCILEVASMPASHTRTSPSIMANLTWLSLVVSWERWLGPFPARFFLLCLLFAHPTNIW